MLVRYVERRAIFAMGAAREKYPSPRDSRQSGFSRK